MKEHYKFYDWKFPAELSLIIVYILYFLYARNRDNLETYSLNQLVGTTRPNYLLESVQILLRKSGYFSFQSLYNESAINSRITLK